MLPGVSERLARTCGEEDANPPGRNPFDRPTADVLLSQHPFCDLDPSYNFADTMLSKKIKENSKKS